MNCLANTCLTSGVLLFGLLVTPSNDAKAQEGTIAAGKIRTIPEVDIGVPQSPAFTVLGLSPQNATNPATVTELGASLFNVLDKSGDLQTGVGLETNPYFVFFGDEITLGLYEESYFTRLLTHTQFSLATAKATGNNKEAVQVALGWHATPWLHAEHDPRRNQDYLNCLVGALDTIDTAGRIPTRRSQNDSPEVERADLVKQAAASIQKANCKAGYLEEFVNPSAWTIGLTPTFISKSGSLDDLDWAGLAVWSTLGLRMDTKEALGFNSQFIVHGRFRLDEVTENPLNPGSFVEQNSAVGALRYRAGQDTWNISAEAAIFYNDIDGAGDETHYQVTGGIEFRVTDGIWLEASGGRTIGRSGDDDSFANISLKWAGGDK